MSVDDVIAKKISMLDAHTRRCTSGGSDGVRQTLLKWYGAQADSVRFAEAVELCEYGRRPSEEEPRRLFPFFPAQKQRTKHRNPALGPI